MITIFTTPKPFHGHNGVIQENAIKSWRSIIPECEVVILGKGHGVKDIASKYGCKYQENVVCSEDGTPLVNSLFFEAERLSSNHVMCYANCDIMFTSALVKAVQLVIGSGRQKFLIIGQRHNADIDFEWGFDSQWETKLNNYVINNGTLNCDRGMDYFIYPKGLIKNIPDLIVGRAWWDNWMLYNAKLNFIPIIDGTGMVMAVHQNHDYAHCRGGHQAAYHDGAEVKSNVAIMADGYVVMRTKDAFWVIRDGEIKFAFDRLSYHLSQLTKIWPCFRRMRKVLRKIMGYRKGIQ